MNQGLPVAGYYRISRERDGMIAPEIYEQKIRSYCEAYDLRLGAKRPDDPFFHDIDVSGRAEAWGKRRGLQELLARRSEFSGIVVPSFSRLGRSTKDVLELFTLLDEDGIDLYVVDEQVSTAGPFGRFARTMLIALAELQSDQIKESWRSAFQNIYDKGRVPGAAWAPYGYLYDEHAKNLVPDSDTVPVVKEVFERFIRGESGSAIARDLNQRRIPFERRIRHADGSLKVMREGKRLWWSDAVHRMIEQPIYVGRARVKGTEFDGSWETFIDEDTWNVAQSKRGEMKNRKPRENRGSHLLSGLLICGDCGKNLHYLARGKGGDLYTCRNKLDGEDFTRRCKAGGISARKVEDFVADAFLKTITWEHVQLALRDLDGVPKAASNPVGDRIHELEDQLQRAISLQIRAPGPRAAAKYEEGIAQLEKELDELSAAQVTESVEPEQRRREIQTLGTYFRRMVKEFPELWDLDQPLTADFEKRYRAAFEDFTGWSGATEDERRRLLGLAIENVTMHTNGGGRNSKTLSVRWKPWVEKVNLTERLSA